ncbi:MAG: exosortase A [Thiobacillaceae bacterium]
MSALAETQPATHVSRWPLAVALSLGLLVVLTGLFWPTFHSMVAVWERSETFTHGFLIFPISAWLIWGRRAQIARLSPQPDKRGLMMLVLAGVAWLLADAGSVNVAAQYAFIAILVAAVWAMLGWVVVQSIFFPLMFLFLAVPVGEFLIPPLMEFTANFTVAALQLTGIPVYREGTFFSIPSGDWSVVEGCSGLRYLIASITLGTLYAYLTYRSWKRRTLFTLAAFIVPVFANGGRAYMIVMIAHLSDMKLALGVDHLIYGWLFFGLVMLLLFWIGSFWREDDDIEPEITSAITSPTLVENQGRPSTNLPKMALLTFFVAALWPTYAWWLNQRTLPEMPSLSIKANQSWQTGSPFTDWVPHWVGADRQLRSSFSRANENVLLEIDYYATQRQDAELINSQNFMIRQKHPVWSKVGESLITVNIAGQSRLVRQAQLKSRNSQRLLVWQWNVIDDQRSVNELYAKLALASDRVRLERDDGASILVAAPYEENPSDATKVLADFIQDNEAAILHALGQVSGK